MIDLCEFSACEVRTLLRAGTLSVLEYARALLARIAAREDKVHAWAHLDTDLVMSEASRLDACSVRGPLHGVAIGIKDIMLTRDMPTRHNSPLYRDAKPSHDAACVTSLRSAGALILGKTETVEFAATGTPPPTANPRDLTRTPGGSSSGSAAAVADHHVPLALGTQTGGSMIRPASFCGTFAIKPTWGLVSREGVKPFAPALDTVGWFARTAQDLALLYDVFDPKAGEIPPLHIPGARIAVCRTPVWDQAEAATQNALVEGADRLRQAGAKIIEINLPGIFDGLSEAQSWIMRAEGGASFLADYRNGAEHLHPNIRAMVEDQTGLNRRDLTGAYDLASRSRIAFDALASEFDAILTPSVPGEAPLGLAKTGAMTFNAMWTLLHTPCINVPGLTGPGGLPVGLTLTGPRHADRKLLALAAAVETLFRA